MVVMSPDEFAYFVRADGAEYLVYEIDFLSGDFNGKRKYLEEFSGRELQFVPVKQPVEFEEAGPVITANIYKKPAGWEDYRSYANDRFGSAPYYFSFLAKL
jgi:hypothetical protein